MSVQKFNPSIDYESIPYAQINVDVIQNITNIEAGFVWVYLQTKPKDWKVIKEHLKNHFKIGNAKIKKIFSYLAKHNLIEYIQENNKQGKFGKHDIRVLNGAAFISYPQITTGGSKNRPAVNRSTGFGLLHIKENTNKIEKRESERKKRVPSSALFVPFVPSEANISLATDLGIDITEELESFKHRHKGKKNEYEFERWLKQAYEYKKKKNNYNISSLTSLSKEPKPSKMPKSSPQIRSTVMEYGPGHPTYEANKEWELKHGKRNLTGNNPRGNGVRKAQEYLFLE